MKSILNYIAADEMSIGRIWAWKSSPSYKWVFKGRTAIGEWNHQRYQSDSVVSDFPDTDYEGNVVFFDEIDT